MDPPSEQPQIPTYLIFSRDSVKNTIIHQTGPSIDGSSTVASTPIYKISTEPTGHRTEIRDARTQRLIVAIERKDILPDRVIFPHRNGGKPIAIGQWLNTWRLPDGSPVTTMVTDAGEFIWRMDHIYRWALFINTANFDEDPSPIVHVQTSTSSNPLALVLDSADAMTIRDDIVTGFLVLEQKLRIREEMDR